MRYLFLVHRYLGIAVCLLMASWCLSGLVMMYVSYPSLNERVRISTLPMLDLRACCESANLAVAPDLLITAMHVEMLGNRLIADLEVDGRPRTIDLGSGQTIAKLDIGEAAVAARQFAAGANLPTAFTSVETVRDDQWTVSEEFAPHRPLYKFSWPDRDGTELYVSSISGAAVQLTTQRIRFWNWLGAIPHWVYFTALRRHAGLWSQFVIASALLGCFLTAVGLIIGVRQYAHRPAGRPSPYFGFMLWHHIPGLLFGLLALGWVASGLLSMNPWGLLLSESAQAQRQRLQGAAPHWGALQAALAELANQPLLRGMVMLQSAFKDGDIYFVGTTRDAARIRFSANGQPAPLTEHDLEVTALALGSERPPELMSAPDRYYFSHHSQPVAFPVYRLVSGGQQSSRYYLDPVSGEIVAKLDRNARGYRWLHQGVHRLDFPFLQVRPAWDFLIVALLLGVSLLSLTGCYAAALRVMRLSPDSREK